MPEDQFQPGAAPQPEEAPTTPLHVAPDHAPTQQPQAAPLHTASFAAAGDQCPGCGAHMAVDQRYCLECGQRRGDPRLPFMDAVVFMDSVRQPQGGAASAPPPPPPEKRSRMTANASLIAGVATLVLAIGVGVMIGRSGESNSGGATTPQVIRVEGGGGGGGGTEEATGTTENGSKAEKSSTGSTSGSGGGGQKHAKSIKEAEHEQAATNVLKTNPNVKMAPPTVEKGGACEPGSAGCGKSGKFEGNFFE